MTGLEAEIASCMDSIAAFLKANDRPIWRTVTRKAKGDTALREIEAYDFDFPEDYRALYRLYRGTNPGDTMSRWDSNVFLHSDFVEFPSALKLTKMRIDVGIPGARDRFFAFLGSELGTDIDGRLHSVAFELQRGTASLVATYGRSHFSYVAFDSTLAFLKSVCIAQSEGLLRFEGRDRKPVLAVGPFWEAVKHLNSSANFWPLLRDGKVEW